MKKKIFMVCAALVVSAATVVGVKTYNYYSMPPLMRANLEALTQDENDINIIIYPLKQHIVVVQHGDQFVMKGSVCPLYAEFGGSYTCTHNTIEYSFDCCMYMNTPTNGCDVFPTACTAVLREKYGITI